MLIEGYQVQTDFLRAYVVRGRREALMDMLQLQLQQRFGELAAEAQKRLEVASLAELQRWSERVLTAPSVEAVLA